MQTTSENVIKVLLVANKSETKINKLKAEEFHELGMGEPMLISSEHNLNIVSLKDQIVGDFNIAETTSLSDGKNVVFALIGKPNTGKSTLTNKLLGSKKVITSAQAGTTRDSIAHDLPLRTRLYYNRYRRNTQKNKNKM